MADVGEARSGGASRPVVADRGAAVLGAALRQVADGERPAFETLYRLTSAKLFAVCLRILPEQGEAEDALQEVYLAVWRKAGHYDAARGRPMTWLITLARNAAVDRLRARPGPATAPLELAAEIADERPDPVTLLEASEEERRLHRCLDTLAEGDAAMLRTAFFAGVAYPELAQRAGLPVGTVKSRIRRALIKLRTCLA